MNTRQRVRRHASLNKEDDPKIYVIEVGDLQHERASFTLKTEFERNAESENATSQVSPPPRGAKRLAMSHNLKGTKRARQSGSGLSKAERALRPDGEVPMRGAARVVFPESEYDVLEKRLIALEHELQNAPDNEEFKKLCKEGVLCEERWTRMYCRDYNKDFEEYRNEAITVLKHNLNIRRDGLRPFMKMITSKNGLGDGSPRQPKRDLLTASPAVTIVSGRAPPQHKDYMRGNVKRTFGQCVPVSTLASGPLHNYSSLQNDPCYLIENELFDVESRLKRCPPSSKEFKELAEEGKKLRLEWRHAAEEIRRSRGSLGQVTGYDLKKCVVVNRGGKKVAVPVQDEQISQQLGEGDVDVDVQD